MTVPSSAPLSDIERRILDYMVSYLRANTYQPSIREIGQQFGIKSTKTVSEHLQSLARKGFLERDPSRSRGVRILGMDLQPETVSVPCYARMPLGAEDRKDEKADMHLTLDRRLAGAKGSFFVRARGTELAAMGVEDGDFVLVEPVPLHHLTDGSAVAVRTGSGHEFCTFTRNGQGVELASTGGQRAVTRVSDASRLHVVGKVTALFRRMDGLALGSTAH